MYGQQRLITPLHASPRRAQTLPAVQRNGSAHVAMTNRSSASLSASGANRSGSAAEWFGARRNDEIAGDTRFVARRNDEIAADTWLGARRNGDIAADTWLGARRNGEVVATVTDCGTNFVRVQYCGTALQHCSTSPRRSHSTRFARPRQSAMLTSGEISLQSAWFSLQAAPGAAPLRVQQPDLAINIRQILLVPLSSNFDRHVQRLASRFQKYGLLLYPR